MLKDYRPPNRVALLVRKATGVCFICCLKMLSSATNSPRASCTERLIGVAGCSLRRFGWSFLHCSSYMVSLHCQMIAVVWRCQEGAEWQLACWSLADKHSVETQKQEHTVRVRNGTTVLSMSCSRALTQSKATMCLSSLRFTCFTQREMCCQLYVVPRPDLVIF